MHKLRLTIFASLTTLAFVAPTRAELIYAVNGNNELLTFDSIAPAAILSRTAINTHGNDAILNIDFRPATGQLYGLSGNNNLYVINPGTGGASLVGATGITGGFDYGFDFNPVGDRIRVATGGDRFFRVDPLTSVATSGGQLHYNAGDQNAEAVPQITGAAYTNNFLPSPRTPPPGTELFYIDSRLDILALSSIANNRDLTTVGALGLDVTGLLGFDISGMTGGAFASFSTDGNISGLYTIDLASGTATSLGLIGESILDISAAAVPAATVPDFGSTTVLLGISALGLLYFRQRLGIKA